MLQILIVEDDPMMRIGLKYTLSAYPELEIVGIAENGYMGVESAIALQPDVVVIDVGMPLQLNQPNIFWQEPCQSES